MVGVILIPTGLGLAKMDHDREVSQVERMLVAETDERRRAGQLLRPGADRWCFSANSPAFANVLAEPGTRAEKVRRQGRNIAEVTHHLGYLDGCIRPASARRASSTPTARSSRASCGDIAPAADLSTEEEQAPFFTPTFALDVGQTHQTKPYVSPDTQGMGCRPPR